MKNIFFAAILVLGFITLSGCSGWNQDPLKDKDGILGSGQEKPVEQVNPKPASSEAIRVFGPDDADFQETVESEIEFSARSLQPGYTPRLSIANLSDFPGSTFNPTTGKFKWQPMPGLILPSEVVKRMYIEVVAVGSKPGDIDYIREEKFKITLNRKFKIPTITSVQKLVPSLREGETVNFEVNIEDPDANPADQKTWSTIQILPTLWQKSLAGQMSLQSYSYVNQNTFKAIFTIDLKNAELTTSLDTFSFDLMLISRFNQISDRKSQNISVYTSFSEPKTTWLSLLDFTIGTKIYKEFQIMDPKGELKVSFEGVKNAIPNSSTKCVNLTASNLGCTFIYDTKDETDARVLNFSISTKFRNTNSSDTLAVTKDFNYLINLTK